MASIKEFEIDPNYKDEYSVRGKTYIAFFRKKEDCIKYAEKKGLDTKAIIQDEDGMYTIPETIITSKRDKNKEEQEHV